MSRIHLDAVPGRESALRCYWQVVAGVIPGEHIPEHTRRWALTSGDYKDPEKALVAQGSAVLYAQTLMDASRVNWVTLEWVWL